MLDQLPPPLAPAQPSPGPLLPPGGGVNGIPGAMGMPAPPPSPVDDPSSVQYGITTQQDGTALIYIKNPDGSPGPVIHVFKPPQLGKGKK